MGDRLVRPEVYGDGIPAEDVGGYGGPRGKAPSNLSHNAHKADWVAYAITRGADPADAEAMTKGELIEAYGG